MKQQWAEIYADLESRLYKRKMKVNTDKSTAVIFTKSGQVLRSRPIFFEHEMPWPTEAKY